MKKSIEVSQALQAANLRDSQASSDASEEEDLDEEDEDTEHETDGLSEDDSAHNEK